MSTTASIVNPVDEITGKTNELQRKKRKKIIILVSVIVAVVALLAAGTFVGLKIYNDNKNEEELKQKREKLINNSADEIAGNEWKSIDSDKTFSLNENGGTYCGKNVSSWEYKVPVLNITYVDSDGLFDESSSPSQVTLTLSVLGDDTLQLTSDEGNGERFVKESDYNKVMESEKESPENDGDGIKITMDNYSKYLSIGGAISCNEGLENSLFVGSLNGGTGIPTPNGSTFYVSDTIHYGVSVTGLSQNFNYNDIKVTVKLTGSCKTFKLGTTSKSFDGSQSFVKDNIEVECDITGNGSFGEDEKLSGGAYTDSDVLDSDFEIISISGTVTPA